MESNVVINYPEILALFEAEFASVKASDDNFAKLNIVVGDEQAFIKTQDKTPDSIYVVVKFGQASINFGQSVLPITLQVMGVHNKIRIVQDFLNKFANLYNRTEVAGIQQLYMSPTANLNFSEVFTGFRTIFAMFCTFVISNGTLIKVKGIQYVYTAIEYNENTQQNVEVTKTESIDIVSYNDKTENSLDINPYPDNNGRARSYGAFQTFAFSIVTYPDGSKQFFKDIMKWKFDTTKSHQNDTFQLKIIFENSGIDVSSLPIWNYKCHSADFNQIIGENPTITIAFSL